MCVPHQQADFDVSSPAFEIAARSSPLELPSEFHCVDEARLIARAGTEPEAFGQLFEAHYRRVLNFTYRCTLNIATAEDLTANTFFKALRAIHRYRHRSSFSSWLYRIAMNEVRMHWRSTARLRQTTSQLPLEEACDRVFFDVSATETHESLQERLHAFAQLRALVQSLPHRYRSVLVLRFFEELPYETIAEVMGRRIGTVKSLVHRGVKRLKKIIEEDATLSSLRHFG
jgi:RNA polymerase sigma-70 factor (ECF subfamily)